MTALLLRERLRSLRLYTGLSTRGLDEIAGLRPTHVQKIENGVRQNPAGDTLVRLAKALGTTVEYLVTGDGAAPTRLQVLTAVEEARLRHERAVSKKTKPSLMAPPRKTGTKR